jgi:hypothetical protein
MPFGQLICTVVPCWVIALVEMMNSNSKLHVAWIIRRELHEELGIKLPVDAFELIFVFLQEWLVCSLCHSPLSSCNLWV